MPEKQLTLQNIHGSDPIAKFVFGKLQAGPISVALFFVLAGILYSYVVPIFLLKMKPANDMITLINIILVFPTAGYFYAHQPKSILRIYNSVTKFIKEEGDKTIPFEKIKDWHARAIWWVSGILIGLISAGFGILTAIHSPVIGWENANWAQILFVFGVRFLAMSMIGVIAARHIATSMKLNGLFQYTQFPLTLDTDRIDVFSAVKRFSLESIGIAAIIGLNLGIQPLVLERITPEYIFYVVMYFILAPVAFFLPLWEAHRRMVAIKTHMLDKLHADYQEEADKLYDSIAKVEKKDLSDSYLKRSEGLVSIKKAIELINQSPDWPFEGTTFYRLVLTIASPFVFVLWDIIVNMISNIVLAQ